jgi:hypothetical protein
MKQIKIPDWIDPYLKFLDQEALNTVNLLRNGEINKNDVRAALIYQCNSQIKLLNKLHEAGLLK